MCRGCGARARSGLGAARFDLAEGPVGEPDGASHLDHRGGVEGTVDVGVNAVGVVVANGRGYAVEVDDEDEVRSKIVLVERVGDLEEIDLAVGAMDESVAVECLGMVVAGVRLGRPDRLWDEMVGPAARAGSDGGIGCFGARHQPPPRLG